MTNSAFVSTQTFDNAHSFIAALRLTDPSWSFHVGEDSAWMRGWYFRGHGDANWSLTPTALRTVEAQHPVSVMREFHKRQTGNIEFLIDAAYQNRGIEKNADIIKSEVDVCFNAFCEYMLIKEFIEYADDLGHPVPELPIFVENLTFQDYYIEELFGRTKNPIFWMTPSVVISQHHGIPTRLLDWTKNPLVAAYFAASSVPKENVDGSIAVYALSHFILNISNIALVKVPRSSSSYLHAQSGVLTYYLNTDDMYIKKGRYLSLEEALEVEFSGKFPTQDNILRKFELPVSEVGELLRLLWLENISKAHLMPILDNVTEALKLKWRFARTGK